MIETRGNSGLAAAVGAARGRLPGAQPSPAATMRKWAFRGLGRFGIAVVAAIVAAAMLAGVARAAEQKLTASDGAAVDLLGWSVAISGDTMVVGAVLDDVGADNAGSAYVFVRSAGAWSEQQKLTASDGIAGDQFGGRVAIDGDSIVVGARSHDAGANVDQGSAYVFVRSAGVWSEQQKLTASDGAAFEEFGSSVAIGGDTVIVGDEGDGFGQGSAFVFTRSGGIWSEHQKLTAGDGSRQFGHSVAMDGDALVVGAIGDTVGTNVAQGSAYVFARSAGAWSEQQKLTAGDGSSGDFFGHSVAINGATVVVGAEADDVSGNPFRGSAYVFVHDGAVWSEQQKLTASDGASLRQVRLLGCDQRRRARRWRSWSTTSALASIRAPPPCSCVAGASGASSRS